MQGIVPDDTTVLRGKLTQKGDAVMCADGLGEYKCPLVLQIVSVMKAATAP
jgi:hypothetical protein